MKKRQKLKAHCDKYKSLRVGKFSNLEEEIEKLPTDTPKDHWKNRKFSEFLKEFKDIIYQPWPLKNRKKRKEKK